MSASFGEEGIRRTTTSCDDAVHARLGLFVEAVKIKFQLWEVGQPSSFPEFSLLSFRLISSGTFGARHARVGIDPRRRGSWTTERRCFGSRSDGLLRSSLIGKSFSTKRITFDGLDGYLLRKL